MIPSRNFFLHVFWGLLGSFDAFFIIYLFWYAESVGSVIGFLENGLVFWSFILFCLALILLITIFFGIRRDLNRNIFCRLMGIYGFVMMLISSILLVGTSPLSIQLTRFSSDYLFIWMLILGLGLILNQSITSLKSV